MTDNPLAVKPPVVLVAGMFRSGSTRAWNLIREAGQTQFGVTEFPGEHYSNVLDLEKALVAARPGVYKEHILTPVILDAVRSGRVTVVATVRDPIEAMTSAVASLGWTVDEALTRTDVALQCVEDAARTPDGAFRANVHVVGYNKAISNNLATIRSLLRTAGVDVSATQLIRLAFRWSKTRVASITPKDPHPETSGYDPVTLLHPGHVGTVPVLPPGPDRARMISGCEEYRFYSRIDALTPLL